MDALLLLAADAGIRQMWLGTATTNSSMRTIASGTGGTEDARFEHTLPNGDEVESIWYRFGPR